MQIVKSFDLRNRAIILDEAFARYCDDESQSADHLVAWLKVASPCNQDWNGMPGDERKRFCRSCEKYVYNLAAMSRTEVLELMKSDTDKKICKRVRRRFDGTVITSDCPVGKASKEDSLFLKLTLLSWLGHPIASLLKWLFAELFYGQTVQGC